MSRRLAAVLALAVALLGTLLVAPAQAALPSQERWVADTYTAMYGSRSYVGARVTQGGHRLAVNLDIDNTSMATKYAPGTPVAVTLRFARYAKAHGVTLLFNTGRDRTRLTGITAQLRAAGYAVTEVCGRKAGESLTHSKQRCRQHFVDEGYTLIANVGNRSTDFTGGGYERGFKLPDYGNQLA